MAHDATVAVFETREQAQSAVQQLLAEGVPVAQISVVARTLQGHHHLEQDIEAGDDQTEQHAAKGAAIGGAFGALAGLTSLAIPGLGLVAAAGALAMGMTGAIAGAAIGSYAGFGLSGHHVEKYERLLNDGKILVIVHGNPLTVAQAHALLRTLPAEETNLHAKTDADSPEIADTPSSLAGNTAARRR